MRRVAGAAVLLLGASCGSGSRDNGRAMDASPDLDRDVSVAGTPAPDGESAVATDRQRILRELTRMVIVPAHGELAAAGPGLTRALAELQAAPVIDRLVAAQAVWQSTRALWRRTNAFGIGPGDDLGITAGVIDEPADPARIDRILLADTQLDATAVRSLPANVRGFLALEYLLFAPGADQGQILRAFEGEGERRRALYAELLGSDLKDKFVAIADAWTQQFGRELEQAGHGSAAFARERDAFEALLNKAVSIADRSIDILRHATGAGMSARIPPVAVRSDNVAADILDDLTGLEALYSGRRDGGATSISIQTLVQRLSAGVDVELVQALREARAAVTEIPRPVSGQAATAQPVIAAMTALRRVKVALATSVFSVLGLSLGFSDNDGD